MLNNNDVDEYKSSKKEKKEANTNSIKDIYNKYKSNKNNNFISYKKEVESLNLFLSNLKGKNVNKIKLANNHSLNFEKRIPLIIDIQKLKIKRQK